MPPQDLKYRDEPSQRRRSGDDTTVREHASVHAGTRPAACRPASAAAASSWCRPTSHTMRGSASNVVVAAVPPSRTRGDRGLRHHRGARSACISSRASASPRSAAAGAMVSYDVPPFCTVAGDRARLFGLNTIGLRRRGFAPDDDPRAQARLPDALPRRHRARRRDRADAGGVRGRCRRSSGSSHSSTAPRSAWHCRVSDDARAHRPHRGQRALSGALRRDGAAPRRRGRGGRPPRRDRAGARRRRSTRSPGCSRAAPGDHRRAPRAGVTRAVMVGGIAKPRLSARSCPTRGRSSDGRGSAGSSVTTSCSAALAEELDAEGIRIVPSTTYLDEIVPAAGVLGYARRRSRSGPTSATGSRS